MTHDLGYFDGAKNLAAPRQPLRPKVVTHVLGTFCTYVFGLDT
jgi:hypothetical protein